MIFSDLEIRYHDKQLAFVILLTIFSLMLLCSVFDCFSLLSPSILLLPLLPIMFLNNNNDDDDDEKFLSFRCEINELQF